MDHTRTLALTLIALCFGFTVAGIGLATPQEAKAPRVGIIIPGGPGPVYDLIRQGFAQLGYVEGKSIIFEPRFARGQPDRARGLAAELVALNVDVIAGPGLAGVGTAREVTKTIPIVFSAAPDPVALGFVASLERPGGNMTGITSFDPHQAAGQVAFLKELLPRLTRVAILSDQNIPRVNGTNPLETPFETAARAAGLQTQWFKTKSPAPDIEGAFKAMMTEAAEAVVVLEVPVNLQNLEAIAELAAKHRLPTIFPAGWQNNGLVSYGTSILDATARIPAYVDKILKGAKPAELPVEVITRRRLVINLKTAREIGVTVPPDLLKRADRVID